VTVTDSYQRHEGDDVPGVHCGVAAVVQLPSLLPA